MNLYQATYNCTCNERQCSITVTANEKPVPKGPPQVCPYGKNISNILQATDWELKAQRFTNEEAQK